MKVKVDPAGRLLVPKVFREQFGITPGAEVDVTPYGGTLQITPGGRGGWVERSGNRLVINGTGELTDEVMYAVIDAGRR